MRISKFVQYLAFGSLLAFPWFVAFFVSGVDPRVIVYGMPIYWLLWGVGAALFHRNFEEG